VKKIVKISKKNKEIDIARNAKLNPKDFYKYVNERRIVKDSIGPLKAQDGLLKTSNADMAKLLNDYFSSVFTIEDAENIPELPEYKEEDRLNEMRFTQEDVLGKLTNLDVYKSFGPDQVHPRVLKVAKDGISQALSYIFNKSMETAIIPENWKIANVRAIHKKGNRQDPGNYRPISLTSVVGKTMERLVKDQLVDFLERNKLIRDSQHGFRHGRSCLTNLLDFFGDVISTYDECKAVDVVYLDFQKAFDKVPHQRLLLKIQSLGIGGNVIQWLRAWLIGRKQRVSLNNTESDWTNVTSGVPQGSVLGPVMFIMYVDGMDTGIISKLSKFADDTKLCHRAIREEDKMSLQKDLNKLIEWSETWQMNFNVSKCTVMHIGCRNIESNYKIGETDLVNVTEQRDLGVIITNDLKWGRQCDEAFRRANRTIGFVNRNFHCRTKEIIMPIYKAMIRPHIEFAVQLWSPHLRKDIDKLERIQRRITKMIPELRNKSYSERLIELNLTTLEKRRLRGQLIETFKYLQGFNNVEPEGLFDRDANIQRRNNGRKLIVKPFNTSVAQNFFPIEITQTWNRLPANVVQSETVNMFKNRLDDYWRV
jgi:hypothetical protein